MGCDGGTIAGRKDMVQVKKRAVTAHSARSQARAQANSCALSQEALRAPVVACAMGLLFNKDALIEYLLAKQRYAHFSHIQGLKDVANVSLQWTEVGKDAASASASASAAIASAAEPAEESKECDATVEADSLYCCPITALPSNGQNKFVAMQPCGCVVSERALRSVRLSAREAAAGELDGCLVCSKPLALDTPPSPSAVAAAAISADPSSSVSPFLHASYRTLFPGPEEVLWLRAQLAEKARLRDAEKAAKKAAKKAEAGAGAMGEAEASVGAAAAASGSASAGASAPAAAAASASASSAAPKRKAGGDSDAALRVSKKAMHAERGATGAHARSVAERTGNTLADTVARITAQADAAVAERRKDANFNAMFLTEQQIRDMKHSSISTKPDSCMSML